MAENSNILPSQVLRAIQGAETEHALAAEELQRMRTQILEERSSGARRRPTTSRP